ncbi:MAG: MFS transporter [Planctomycetes bacterium]|nr:MFS transporter [Planctomycetota bacterium]
MLFRFSLYGFLKNQRYFEPFLVLAFLEKGLSYSEIGLLIGFREVSINLMEIPTGAIADVFGRRRSMVFSMLGYVFSFVVFTYSTTLWQLFPAMFLYAVGDAFRTGTHKAIILDWLRAEGRENERTQTYGYTRSWSKIGSTVMAPLALVIALFSRSYSQIFMFSIIPYIANIVNLATYPKYLDGGHGKDASMKRIASHLWKAARHIFGRPALRRMLVESMTYQGLYSSVKDYVQPIVKTAAVALPLFALKSAETRTKILVTAVYFVIGMLEALASRKSHAMARACGDENRAAYRLWWGTFILYAAMVPLFVYGLDAGLIAAFVALAVLMNLWRPIMISRIDEHSEAEYGATILSVDSQVSSGFTMVAAPVIGLLVDWAGAGAAGLSVSFWPVAAVGVLVAALVILGMGEFKVRVEPQDTAPDVAA